MQAANIDALVKTRVSQALRRWHRITNKAITAAFPRCGFHALKIALDVLIKLRTIAAEQRVVIRWQTDFDLCILRKQRSPRSDHRQQDHQHPLDHLRFFAPIFGHVFSIDAISAAVNPEAIKIWPSETRRSMRNSVTMRPSMKTSAVLPRRSTLKVSRASFPCSSSSRSAPKVPLAAA